MVHEIKKLARSGLIYSASNPDEGRLIGFVIGSDVAGIRYGDMLEMSNTNAYTLNRPAAYLAGQYSPEDVVEYAGPDGQIHRAKAANKVAILKPEAFIYRWRPEGPEPLADRVLIELDEPEKRAGNIIRPDAWEAEQRTGIVFSAGPDSRQLKTGQRVIVERRRGSKVFRREQKTILSIRERDVIAHE